MFFIFLFPTNLFAQGLPFEVVGPELIEGTDIQIYVSDLKQRVVEQWLEQSLGEKYRDYEKFVTRDFAERYILDYKLSKVAGRNQYQLNGHLDTDSLRKWLNVIQTKRSGSQLRPFFVVSSTLPQATLAPSDSANHVRQNLWAKELFSSLSEIFLKFGFRLNIASASLSLSQPPRSESEVFKLRNFSEDQGFNACIWVHLMGCKHCGGARLDIYFFNLNQNRPLFARSDDLPISSVDLSNGVRIRSLIKAPMDGVRDEIEDLVSHGILFGFPYRLIIEGIHSYRVLKSLEGDLGQAEYIHELIIKRAEPKIIEFGFISPLPTSEIAKRLESTSFPGFQLKTKDVDDSIISMRITQ